MIACEEHALEQKIIDCFETELKSPFFEDSFKITLPNKPRVRYNFEYPEREFDILIDGPKRLGIGLLFNGTYNIEIETRRCNLKVVKNKYYDNILFSVIAVNGESNSVYESKKAYSLIDFKEDYICNNADYSKGLIPSLKSRVQKPQPIKKDYAFIPKVVNNNCEIVKSIIGEYNIPVLENILQSGIEPNLKKGVLYFLCDNLEKKSIKNLNFIPELMQVSFEDNNGINNCLIDSLFNRRRISMHLVSEVTEDYMTKKFGKKVAKIFNSKKFSLITSDSAFSGLLAGSELSKIYLLNDDIAQRGLSDYIKEVKKL